MGTQPFGFAQPQLFGTYPWKACVPSGVGSQAMQEVYQVTVPSSALSMEVLHATQTAVSKPSMQYAVASPRFLNSVNAH